MSDAPCVLVLCLPRYPAPQAQGSFSDYSMDTESQVHLVFDLQSHLAGEKAESKANNSGHSVGAKRSPDA